MRVSSRPCGATNDSRQPVYFRYANELFDKHRSLRPRYRHGLMRRFYAPRTLRPDGSTGISMAKASTASLFSEPGTMSPAPANMPYPYNDDRTGLFPDPRLAIAEAGREMSQARVDRKTMSQTHSLSDGVEHAMSALRYQAAKKEFQRLVELDTAIERAMAEEIGYHLRQDWQARHRQWLQTGTAFLEGERISPLNEMDAAWGNHEHRRGRKPQRDLGQLEHENRPQREVRRLEREAETVRRYPSLLSGTSRPGRIRFGDVRRRVVFVVGADPRPQAIVDTANPDHVLAEHGFDPSRPSTEGYLGMLIFNFMERGELHKHHHRSRILKYGEVQMNRRRDKRIERDSRRSRSGIPVTRPPGAAVVPNAPPPPSQQAQGAAPVTVSIQSGRSSQPSTSGQSAASQQRRLAASGGAAPGGAASGGAGGAPAGSASILVTSQPAASQQQQQAQRQTQPAAGQQVVTTQVVPG